MKKFTKIIALSLAIVMGATTMSGCMGKTVLLKKLYSWNGTVTGNKFVNNIIFWVLCAVPVYGIAGLIDFAVLNLVEFWTGSNPMAMAPGQKEVKQVTYEGTTFEVTATQNRLDIVALTGKQAGVATALIFRPETKTWYAETADGARMVAKITGDDTAEFINPYPTAQ